MSSRTEASVKYLCKEGKQKVQTWQVFTKRRLTQAGSDMPIGAPGKPSTFLIASRQTVTDVLLIKTRRKVLERRAKCSRSKGSSSANIYYYTLKV